jgi:hypothetical protein
MLSIEIGNSFIVVSRPGNLPSATVMRNGTTTASRRSTPTVNGVARRRLPNLPCFASLREHRDDERADAEEEECCTLHGDQRRSST